MKPETWQLWKLYHTLEPPKTDTSENLYHIVELRKLTPLKTYIIQRWSKSDTSENNYHTVEHSKTDNSEDLHHTTMIETWHLWKQLSYSGTLENLLLCKPTSHNATRNLTPLKTYIMQWNRNLTPLKSFIMQWTSRRPTHLKTGITQWNPENWHLWKPTSRNVTSKTDISENIYYTMEPLKPDTSKNEWKCTKRKIILKVVWNYDVCHVIIIQSAI